MTVPHSEIEARARTIWEECGRPAGCELEHWLRAERQLEIEQQQAQEFRAGLSGEAPHAAPPRGRPRHRA
jgi:hypothetical protein